MTSYAFFAVVIIYVLWQILIRWEKMVNDHTTLADIGTIVVIWGTIFFGVWVLPLSDSIKITIDAITSIIVVSFGLMYFMVRKLIPSPTTQTLERTRFWLMLLALILLILMQFSINIITWEVVTIDGVSVVTQTNLHSLFYGVMGVLITVFTIWYIIKRNPYKNHVD
jgi:hypothetical protein